MTMSSERPEIVSIRRVVRRTRQERHPRSNYRRGLWHSFGAASHRNKVWSIGWSIFQLELKN